ncbi:anthranilate synthase family protein [Kitasatospora aureofaciens]|uniref:anthranilate synthase family protein n=1 Tax=Kitasatospora aureofaciens TaxID=1894 RepID=UPI001D4B26E4|nr:anthranilate synthase family protein [Kitasatospora aureofaciens]HJD80867.1 anthranilate synthase family protein [Kitasatospora aureofaciens]
MTGHTRPLHDEAPGGLLGRLLAPDGEPAAYALLHRPESGAADRVEVVLGEVAELASLAELPLEDGPAGPAGARHELLVVVPFRQVAERGFAAPDDGAPLLALRVTDQEPVDLADALRLLPDDRLAVRNAEFALDDEAYAELVRTVLTEEIGHGRGANFVLERPFTAEIDGFGARAALSVFRRLLAQERGTYWTFLVRAGDRYFVGASPERHVSAIDGEVVMNPISGTYRYPADGPSVPGLLDFLADRKETDELLMVVDEELKMMGRICEGGGRVVGPYLKPMARLAHTEYLIEGSSTRPIPDILRETLFAPTVTGSPLESACELISRYEPGGRGYYSGVLALVGRDATGGRWLDSAILIRTARIDRAGRLRMGVGATLVRHSDPRAEVAETYAKAAGMLAAVRGTPDAAGPAPAAVDTSAWAGDARIRAALAGRNAQLAPFWLSRPDVAAHGGARGRVLLVDAEDTFTAMIGHQLSALGLEPEIRRWDDLVRGADGRVELPGADLVVVGPGPGDPREVGDAKIATLRALTRQLLREQRPFLSICLGHQVLAGELGLPLVRKPQPNQGRQRVVDLFGRQRRVGFYNSFAAVADRDEFVPLTLAGSVAVSRDAASGEVHGLRGPHFHSLQFHPESVLSTDGFDVLRESVTGLLGVRAVVAVPTAAIPTAAVPAVVARTA